MNRPEKLNSDKVNYLIWRYLQEAGFAQTAARLQQDWPLQGRKPDDLYFSRNIQPRALIQLLQYGLKYHRVAIDNKPNTPLFFGAEPESSASTIEGVTTIASTKSSSPVRLNTDTSTPSSASKSRNRKTNGTTISGKPPRAAGSTSGPVSIGGGGVESMDVDQSAATHKSSEDGMEIDGEGYNTKPIVQQQSPTSPTRNDEQLTAANESAAGNIQEQQQIPSPIPTPTLTNGTSIGIQSENAISLVQRTTVIETDERVKTIHHLEWNPTSTNYLAIAGGQLGQVWQIAKDEIRTATTEDRSQRISPKSVHDLNGDANTTVASIAWSPDGKRLLYSVLEETGDQHSCIKINNGKEDVILGDTAPQSLGAVTKLVWSPDGNHVAGFTDSRVFIYDVINNYRLAPVETDHDLMDIIWISNERLIVCGSSYIAAIRMQESEAGVEYNFDQLAGSADWSILRWNSGTSSIALASEATGEVAVLESPERYSKDSGHGNSVTDLVYDPRSSTGIFATASEDGTVCVWESRPSLSRVSTLVLDGVSTPASVAFSPNGNMLAAADWDKVFIWDWQKDIKPAHMWEARNIPWPITQVNGRITNGTNGHNHDHDIDKSSMGEEPPVLRWAAHGLTFAYENKVAIIDVPF